MAELLSLETQLTRIFERIGTDIGELQKALAELPDVEPATSIIDDTMYMDPSQASTEKVFSQRFIMQVLGSIAQTTNAVKDSVGYTGSLLTDNKVIVDAINELLIKINNLPTGGGGSNPTAITGNLADLNTSEKTNLVAAINSVRAQFYDNDFWNQKLATLLGDIDPTLYKDFYSTYTAGSYE